jgi:hypothetical protein
VTPETQAAAAARDGFVTYDELRGPDLDAARWSPARLPLPTGGDHIPLDPNAELAVGEGEVRVTIPRFSMSHDTFQPADSAKYLIFSTPVRAAAGSARDVRRRPRGQEHRRGTGGLPAGNGRLPRVRLRRLHPASRVRDHPRPEQLDLGIWTMLPIRDGHGRSLDGQGMNARWHRFRVRGVDASPSQQTGRVA